MITINRVIEGPVHISDMPIEEWPPFEVLDADQHWLMEVEVEDSEGRSELLMSIEDFELAYGIEKHFKSGGSPIEVRDDFSLWSDDELLWDGDE